VNFILLHDEILMIRPVESYVRFLFRTDCSVFLQLGMNVLLPVENTSTSRNWSLSQEGSGILLNETYAYLCLWFLTLPILQKECDYAVSPLEVDVLHFVYNVTAQAMTIRT
jgi:hypothetical protein